MTNNPEEEEDEEEIVTENMYNSELVDPLSDPLAIEDVIINQTEDDGSELASGSTTLTELDSSGEGQIILVDVNSLKNAFPATMPASPYGSCSSALTYGVSGNGSNITNRKKTFPHARGDKDSGTVLRDNYDEVGTSLALNVSGDDGIGVTFEPIALALEDEVNDEIEGVRSDGSDSGLGLELSAGILLDKSTASTSGKLKILSSYFQFDLDSFFFLILYPLQKQRWRQNSNQQHRQPLQCCRKFDRLEAI